MTKLKEFLTEKVPIPMWAIIIFDLVVLGNIIINIITILGR